MIAINRAWTTPSARALATVGVVGLSLLASACGGSSHASVAQIGTTTGPTPAGASDDPNVWSRCMRSHGVPNFPDPDSNNVFETQGIDKSSPAFKAAAHACLSLAPTPAPPGQQAREQAQMLAFAECMRSHGVPKFPDPQSGGTGWTIDPGQIDPNSPIVKAAIAACRSTFAGSQKLPNGLAGPPQKRGPRK